jgi:hypothetical protein
MASVSQIAANRRNCGKSTGPRSSAAKMRSSRNAHRHGLTLDLAASPAFSKQIAELARKIVGKTENVFVLQSARAVAEAMLDLARVRQAKAALVARAYAFGELDRPELFRTVGQIARFFKGRDRGRLVVPRIIDAAASMPTDEGSRSAEAMRRVLPELLKLDRYERHASVQRDRAVRDIIASRTTQLYNQK